ncbi:MAG: hypothetical protein IKP48_05895 [Bacteroidaceae bacterium]|nr:hypothetical protein [Bacteroidaceae bacterium]
MKTKSIFGIVLTGVMCLCLIGCQNDDFMEKTNPLRTAQKGVVTGDTWSLNLEATISDVADTRVVKLEKDDSNNDVLNGYWVEGEKIGVYLKGVKLGFFEITEVIEGSNGKSAKFYGTGLLDTGMVDGDNVLTLIYPDNDNVWDYTGQNGTLDAISKTYDYMLASLTVNKEGSKVKVTDSSTSFSSQQSVYRFGLKDGDNNAISVKQLMISSAKKMIVKQLTLGTDDKWTRTYGSLTITPPENPTTDLLYVAILNEQAETAGQEDTYELSAIGSDNALYMGTKATKGTEYDFLASKVQFNSAREVAMKQAKLTPNASATGDAW